jgi:hypothetical protein
MDYAIPVKLSDLIRYYPEVVHKGHDVGLQDKALSLQVPGKHTWILNEWVTGLKHENPSYTTCCIQMSHAINMAFYVTDRYKMVGARSKRAEGEPGRPNHSVHVGPPVNGKFYYVAAVDEFKEFLTDTFGKGENISSSKDVEGRPGIMIFMNKKRYGEHTEIWEGPHFHQRWMKSQEKLAPTSRFYPFNWKPIWFWSVIPG